ncbi:MAG: hypothetical protein Q9209_003824 [Squamulea sp. 1 TL-2023]
MAMPLPPLALRGPTFAMGTLITQKMKNHKTRSTAENRSLNQQMKQVYDSLNGNPAVISFLEPKGFCPYWDRFGTLIESWVKCDFNVAQQSHEMGDLFREVMAFKHVDVSNEHGKVAVKGTSPEGVALASFMGFDEKGCTRGFEMHLMKNLGAVATIIALALASPFDRSTIKKESTVRQTIPKPKIRSGPAAVAATFLKYGKQPPSNVKAAAAGNDGSVTATPTEHDSQYLTPVTIVGQTVNLDLDTGSSDLRCIGLSLNRGIGFLLVHQMNKPADVTDHTRLNRWVFSPETPSNAGHDIYDPSKSNSSKELVGATWSITYGDQSSSSGIVYTNTVTVGTTSFANQAVELAQQVSEQFQRNVANDGLLGLAFHRLNTVKPAKQKTFFTNVLPSLSVPLFTVDLKKATPGSYDFGFTGTTLLYLPDVIAGDYYASVNGANNDEQPGGYVYPCNADLPDISFKIGSYTAVVSGSCVTYAPVDDSGKTCFGGIQSSTGIGINIFGDIFLKSQFVVFQGGDNPQLGFASKAA